MKKLFLIFVGIHFLFACSGKEEPTVAVNPEQPVATVTQEQSQIQEQLPSCTINGYDCWKVVQLLEGTKTVFPTREEVKKYIEDHYPLVEVKIGGIPVKDKTGKPLLKRNIDLGEEYKIEKNLTRHDNPKLQKMGLTIIDIGHFFDGGSVSYEFSNGITIFKKWNAIGPNVGPGDISVHLPKLESFTFNNKGVLIQHSPAQDCVVNHMSCLQLTQELNRFFGKETEKEKCNDDFCPIDLVELNRKSEDLVGVSKENFQQNGELYTYSLEDGRVLVFNWDPNTPEKGFLTVTETDGTQKKFDPQGNRVNK